MKQPARELSRRVLPHPSGRKFRACSRRVYSGVFWGNGWQLSECNRAVIHNSGAAVCGIVFYLLAGKKPPLVVLNSGKGKAHARSNNRRGDYFRRVCSNPCGGSLGRVPGGVYSGVFWGNGCNYRIAAIMAMFGTLDRL